MTFLQLAWNDLRRRALRNLLTLAGVAVGIAATVSLTAIAWGFENSWKQANQARGTDLLITRAASENTMPSPFEFSAVQQVLAFPEVDQSAGLLSELLTISDGPPMFVFGWEQGSFLWQHLAIESGRLPSASDATEIILGTLAAALIKKELGDEVYIEDQTFQVVGLFSSSAAIENGAAILPLQQMQELTGRPGKINVLNLKLRDQLDDMAAQRVRDEVVRSMPGYIAVTSGDLVRQNLMVRIAKAMSWATALIAGIVGAVGVLNTLLMSVYERRRELGLLMAIGWPPYRVLQLVVCEALMVAAAGGILGLLLGGLGISVIEQLDMVRGKIEADFSPMLALGAFVLALVVGGLGGFYPGWRASRLTPASLMREE